MRSPRHPMAAHRESGGALAAAGPASPEAPVPDPGREAPLGPPEDRRVRRRDLLNLLNYVNFLEGSVFVSFRNSESGDAVTYQAAPLPCADENLSCRWLVPLLKPEALAGYECSALLLSDGMSHVTVEAELVGLDAAGASFRLPESGRERRIRSIERFACEGIEARVIQSGISFEGRLLDFNAESFRVEARESSSGSLRWLNPAAAATVVFSRDGVSLYSADCRIGRTGGGGTRRELVLLPRSSGTERFPRREYRSRRLRLAPTPRARFRHPLTGRKVELQAEDISAAGMRVAEFLERSTLMPGLVIPELAIDLGNSAAISCRAQVLYRNVEAVGEQDGTASCGIAFLDMGSADQARLSSLLHQSIDGRLRVCGAVDMEELWRFFFESGFIYPSKYLAIQPRKEEFKRTYDRLYLESPSIARHFIFQDKGVIFGHMSMLRFYPRSWIIHHHAASRSGYGAAGVEVLDQVGRYANEFYRYPSAHIDYLVCYYREENRFPARVFGNVARDIADPKGSSVDVLSYLRLPEREGGAEPGFQLFPSRAEDLEEARRRYESVSGGLLLDALDLAGDPESEEDRALSGEYALQGFKRERRVFSLREGGALRAVIALALSDAGLNLSNLTNCAHAIVVDGKGLRPEVLTSALRALLERYGALDLPVLVFPSSYIEGTDLPREKEYSLWVLNTQYGDGYFDSLDRTFRRKGDAGK